MKKSSNNQYAISAVIGVIIMVAITVAMAAAALAFFTGLIGEQKKQTPNIEFTKLETDVSIIIATADIDTKWDDINIVFTNETTSGNLITPKIGPINAGDRIDLRSDQILRGKVTVIFTYIPTNSLLGSYIIENV